MSSRFVAEKAMTPVIRAEINQFISGESAASDGA
jgi:hypothetical protein